MLKFFKVGGIMTDKLKIVYPHTSMRKWGRGEQGTGGRT